MYDSGKIIPGLVIFFLIIASPFLYTMGKAAPAPKLEKPAQAKECVENTEYMRTTHMQLLNEWRDQALREGNRVFVNAQGQKIWISLQNTCLKCHSDPGKFCDRCHVYAGVKPYCWDCHFAPKGNTL